MPGINVVFQLMGGTGSAFVCYMLPAAFAWKLQLPQVTATVRVRARVRVRIVVRVRVRVRVRLANPDPNPNPNPNQERFGLRASHVDASLRERDFNHATATYLLVEERRA